MNNIYIISINIFVILTISLSSFQNENSSNPKTYGGSKSNEAIILYNAGDSLRAEGNYEDAIKKFHLAMSIDKEFLEVYDNIALVYQNMGNLDSAEYYYNKSLELYSGGVNSNFNLSVIYIQSKKLEKAKKLLINMLEANPNSARGYYGLANIHIMNGDFEQCIVNINKAIPLFKISDPSNLGSAYMIKGYAFANSKDLDSAKVYFKLAESTGIQIPDDVRPLIQTDEENDQEMLMIIDKLLDTPVNDFDKDEFKLLGKKLLIWIPKKDRGTILLSEPLLTTSTCSQCMAIFLAAWSKYHLEVGDNNLLEGAYYTIERTIKYYQDNRDFLEANEALDGFIKAKEEGRLKEEVENALSRIDFEK